MADGALSLSDHATDFVDEQVRSGRYRSASEVVDAGLRLLADHQSRLDALHQALSDGEKSGVPQPFDGNDFLAEMRQKHGRENS